MSRSTATLLLAACLAGACGCKSEKVEGDPGPAAERPLGGDQEPVEVPFEILDRGDQAGLSAPLAQVIRTPEAWAEVWATRARSRTGEIPLPQVDWERDMLAVVAIGERSSAGYGVEVLGVERVGQMLRVRAAEKRPPPDSMQAQVMTHPYVVLRLESFEGPVNFVIE